MLFLLYLMLLGELLLVAYYDLKTKKISNYWSIIHIAFYIMLLIVYPQFYEFSWNSLLYSGAILGVGFIFFFLKIAGAGDVKFLSTIFLLIPIDAHDVFFFNLLIGTTIFGSILLVFNTLKNFGKIKNCLMIRDYRELRKCYGTKFAFAPVILLSWILLGFDLKIIPSLLKMGNLS